MIRLIGRTPLLLFSGIALALFILVVSSVLRIIFMERAYQRALADGKTRIGYVAEFDKLFPKSCSYFSYYTGEYGPPTWNSVTGLYGRYILSMEVPVVLTSDRSGIKTFGTPRWHLVEVASTSALENGAFTYWAGDTQMEFGEQEWRKIADKGGDISVLGINAIKDKPVPDFERCWRKLESGVGGRVELL
jgi:hypothetical protein